MTEIELIKKEADRIDKKYLQSAIEIIRDYKEENQTRDSYKGRQIFELLQNADDCYQSIDDEIHVKFTLKGNKLIVQNTGKKFTSRGVISLMNSNASSKYKDTIGCKGLGFRAVLNWSKNIDIYTDGFHVNFSEENAKKKFEYYKINTDKDYVNEFEENNMDRIAILDSIIVDDKEYDSMSEYTTSIILKCEDEHIETIQKQLKEFQFEELLFLKHIRRIDIDTSQSQRTITSQKGPGICLIQEGEDYTSWQLWEKHGLLDQPDGKKKKYEICIAYNDDPQQREIIRKNGVLYSFFKTEIAMPFPFLVHGTFDLSSERNGLDKENPNNAELLDILIDFIAEKGLVLCNGKESSYEPLKFLLPAKEIYSLDKDYHFAERIKEKIKGFKIFPTINNEYISLDDAYYSEYDFASVVKPDTFSGLLKKCDDKVIRDFLYYELDIDFYDNGTFVNLINKDADYYVQKGLNASILNLLFDKYSKPLYLPNILTDSNGNRVTDNTHKIFNNPKNYNLELPDWCEMHYINEELEEKLEKHLQCNARILMEKLSVLGCVEYAFDKIVREMIGQCKNDVDKTKKLIEWLFLVWNNNNKFPSDISSIDIPILARDQSIHNASDCYIGKEYNNKIGEDIIQYMNSPYFVPEASVFGLDGFEVDKLTLFYIVIGVSRFPKIRFKNLDREDTIRYIRNLFIDRKYIRTNHESYELDYILNNTYGYSAKVDTIDNLNEILMKSPIENIVYWLIQDKRLQSFIYENESRYWSQITFEVYGKKNSRIIQSVDTKSWIKYVFTSTDWLPTKTNIKTGIFNVTLNEHNLSPIVEVLNIDYERLDLLFGRKMKKEVEVILEKLGMAEDYVNLPKDKIYEILLRLPEIDPQCLLGGKVYQKINMTYDFDATCKLVDNGNYSKFKQEGKVVAIEKGKKSYQPVSKVYYVEKKIYSDSMLDDFPKLEMKRRAGDKKIQMMFCVRPIKIEGVIIKNVKKHPLNAEYQNEYVKIIPYIYARRIEVDSNNKDFNAIKRTVIKLVSYAETEYTNNGKTKNVVFGDYEFNYSDSTAYIKIPESITSIEELKNERQFIQQMAEIFTIMFDVDKDKDTFANILSCKNIAEMDRYYLDDNNINTLNLSKDKFNVALNYKDEFWNALSLTLGTNAIELINEYSSELGDDFNYTLPDEDEVMCIIINLFKKLKIDIEEYNDNAYSLIDITNYYRRQFQNLINLYRKKYYTFIAEKAANENDFSIFEKEKQRYDFYDIEFKNSIYFDVNELFENYINMKIEELSQKEENYEELLSLIDMQQDEPINEPIEIEKTQPSPETNYQELVNNIKNDADAIVESNVKTMPINEETRRKGNSTTGGAKSPRESQETKLKNGFIAEALVYFRLLKIVGESGSVLWESENAKLCRINALGVDGLGYDIRYSDDKGSHFVEVKSSTQKDIEFIMTKNELDFARKNKNNYEVWFVQIEDEKVKQVYKLGNILDLDEGEDFLDNSKYSVRNNDYKIMAKIIECDDFSEQ